MNDQTKKIEEKSKSEGIKTWLETKQYWEKYLWKLHLEKDSLNEVDIDKCYQYLLEDSGVIKVTTGRKPIVFPVFDLDSTDAVGVKSTLDKIANLKNVNAIDDGCVIEFGKNLTIVYGDNGAGKSGIGRLLSNACLSRKPRGLLPDVHKVGVALPSADFYVTDTTGQSVIKYSLGNTHQTLKAFSVFDHECALIHLNSENQVEFMPAKILVFDEVFKSVLRIEMRMQAERDRRQKDNPAEGIFTGPSVVTDFFSSLSSKTTDPQIDKALKFTKTDKSLLAQKKKDIVEKLKQDVTVQKSRLQEECHDLEDFKDALVSKAATLSATKARQINALLKKIRFKKGIVDKLSAKSFDFAAFKHVGSDDWKSFIVAAKRLHDKETVVNGGKEPEYCLLCRKNLTNTDKSLFSNYWKFLQSTAETELTTARGSLSLQIEAFEREKYSWPIFSKTEVAVKILKKDIPDDLKKIRVFFKRLNIQRKIWVKSMQSEKNVVYVSPKINLRAIDKLVVKKRIEERKLVDTKPQITTLNGEIKSLHEKQQASRLIPKIRKYIAWLRWNNFAASINLPSVRGAITRKKTEIMGEIVMSKYVDIFNEETKKLECNFGLSVESHGRDGKTIKELKLSFARSHNPSEILSDGEQTVSALADFFTEVKLDKNNAGVIFDDPVTSLDQERRSTIANRLVQESKVRQVIVFTHDVVFLTDLKNYADAESVQTDLSSMYSVGGKAGFMRSDLPWAVCSVSERVRYLRNELVDVHRKETRDPEQYRIAVKTWYLQLRESWERAVEERLFKGVVQRFNKAVQTQRLDRVDVTPTLVKEVHDGMTESSNWLHDIAIGVSPSLPSGEKLESELQKLDDFILGCKAP